MLASFLPTVGFQPDQLARPDCLDVPRRRLWMVGGGAGTAGRYLPVEGKQADRMLRQQKR